LKLSKDVERGSDNRLPVHILSLKLLELRNGKEAVQQWGTRRRRESTIKEIKVKYEKQTYKSKCIFLTHIHTRNYYNATQTGVTLQYSPYLYFSGGFMAIPRADVPKLNVFCL
jgi:hypothetical protein